MAKSPQEMKAAMIAGLPEKTGKSLDEWRKIVQKAGLTKHKEIVTLLKTQHGVTHGFANMIVRYSTCKPIATRPTTLMRS